MKTDLRKLSQKQRSIVFNKAFAMFKVGQTQKSIALELGVRVATVCDWVKIFKSYVGKGDGVIVKSEKIRGRGFSSCGFSMYLISFSMFVIDIIRCFSALIL